MKDKKRIMNEHLADAIGYVCVTIIVVTFMLCCTHVMDEHGDKVRAEKADSVQVDK